MGESGRTFEDKLDIAYNEYHKMIKRYGEYKNIDIDHKIVFKGIIRKHFK